MDYPQHSFLRSQFPHPRPSGPTTTTRHGCQRLWSKRIRPRDTPTGSPILNPISRCIPVDWEKATTVSRPESPGWTFQWWLRPWAAVLTPPAASGCWQLSYCCCHRCQHEKNFHDNLDVRFPSSTVSAMAAWCAHTPQARLEVVRRGSSVKEEAAVPKLRRLKRKRRGCLPVGPWRKPDEKFPHESALIHSESNVHYL